MLLRETVIELTPGSVLAERFQIRRVVGKGATGVVLEADDRVSRSLVALKVFKPEIATDERWQEIVGSELRHARKIQHPNVCRIYDAGDADGYRFLSMEFATGGTLRQRIKEGGPQRTDEERIADARAVVNGLAAIHEAGIIHRDVKPDNVLRMEDGRLVVTDFGLAIAPGQTTFMSGYSGAVGTPSYMAPEVALGGDATMASDVFSLGVILHELFFDRRPEWETTKRGRFLKPPGEKPRSRLQKSMMRLCCECLEELAPRRPTDASDVRRRFERAVLGRYGTMMSALRAGKWGIALGVMLAAGGTMVATLATRPRRGDIRARVTGVPKDWLTGARLIARSAGTFRCSYPAPDGRSIQVIWGDPLRAEIIDIQTGNVASWQIKTEIFQDKRCPTWSSDGRFVAFMKGARQPRLMVSTHPDGRDARPLINGHSPRWLAGSREIAHGFDRRRVAVTDLAGQWTILPEAAAPEESLYALDRNARGDQIAALYANFRDNRSSVLVYAAPDWKLQRRIEIPMPVGLLRFVGDNGEMVVSLVEKSATVVGTLKTGGELVREGSLGSASITDIHAVPAGRILSLTRRSMSLVLRGEDGSETPVAHARYFGRLSTAPSGDTILQQTLPDGSEVIARYDAKLRQLSAATQGPEDRSPLILPDGRHFVYIARATPRAIRQCPIKGTRPCRVLTEQPGAAALVGVSPSGRRIAYVSEDGVQISLKLLSLDTLASTDLGSVTEFCPLRWPTEERLWIFQRSATFEGWRELDLTRNAPTGSTDPMAGVPFGMCPEEMASSTPVGLRTSSHEEAELWGIPASD
jgi:hypothetical protein